MKKLISLLIIATLLLAGCAVKPEGNTPLSDNTDDTPQLTGMVFEKQADHVLLSVYNSDDDSYTGIRIDTDREDVLVYDWLTFYDKLSPLDAPYDVVSEYHSGPISIAYTVDTDDIVSYYFEPDNINGSGRIVSTANDYVIASYNNRYIKVHCDKEDGWCVGDYVDIKGKATPLDTTILYYNSEIKYEVKDAELSFVEMENHTAAKPVIYLYPEKTTDVSVKIDLDGELTCVYPEYNGLWQVTAEPDGTLTDKNGREYYCLYWEGDFTRKLIADESVGFVVKGEDTAEFLRKKALALGLSEKEANEFIIYWLPQMEDNAYNYIYFAIDQYTDMAKLSVDPAPDTAIRFMMMWKGLDAPFAVTEQVLPDTPERQGFTVVEWGGSEIKK